MSRGGGDGRLARFMADNVKTVMQRQVARMAEMKRKRSWSCHSKIVVNEQAWNDWSPTEQIWNMWKLNYIYCIVSDFQWLFSTCLWTSHYYHIGQLRSKVPKPTSETEIEWGTWRRHWSRVKVIHSVAVFTVTCPLWLAPVPCDPAWMTSHLDNGWRDIIENYVHSYYTLHIRLCTEASSPCVLCGHRQQNIKIQFCLCFM